MICRHCIAIGFFTTIIIATISCAPGVGNPPSGGREITLDQGIHLVVKSPWDAEISAEDWTKWKRVQRKMENEPWLFPPVTAIKDEPGGMYDRPKQWRFKGVPGTFDPNINPTSSEFPVPEGLWHLPAQMLEMVESTHKDLDWPSLQGTTATCRLYENTHGVGDAATLWHTYVVTFNHGANAYEFVISIPEDMDRRMMIDEFWESIEDVEISDGD